MKPDKESAQRQDETGSVSITNPEKPPKQTEVYKYYDVPCIEAEGTYVCPTGYQFKAVFAKIYDEDPGKPDEKPPAGDPMVKKGIKISDTRWEFTKFVHPIPRAHYAPPPECDPKNFLVVWVSFKKDGNEVWRNEKVQFCGTLAGSDTRNSIRPGMNALALLVARENYGPLTIQEPGGIPSNTPVIPVGGQYVIEAEGVANRPSASIEGVFAKIYRPDVGARFPTPPADATAGQVFGASGWEFKNNAEGDFRIPGALGSTGTGSDNNLLVVWAFFGGDPGDSANYYSNEIIFRGLLVDPPPGGGSVGDT